jgi:Ricin-type beta-trefoil lectin domain
MKMIFTRIRMKTLAAVSVCVFALAAGVGTITPAFAQSGPYVIKSATGNWVLDGNADGDIYVSTPNGGAYQDWYLNGSTLESAGTGRCLDSNANGDVYSLGCNGGNYQNWIFYANGWIKDAQTGRCLNAGWFGVTTQFCTTDRGVVPASQVWTFLAYG